MQAAVGIGEEVDDELDSVASNSSSSNGSASAEPTRIRARDAASGSLDERLRGVNGGDVGRAEPPRELSSERTRAAANVERPLTGLDARRVAQSRRERGL